MPIGQDIEIHGQAVTSHLNAPIFSPGHLFVLVAGSGADQPKGDGLLHSAPSNLTASSFFATIPGTDSSSGISRFLPTWNRQARGRTAQVPDKAPTRGRCLFR